MGINNFRILCLIWYTVVVLCRRRIDLISRICFVLFLPAVNFQAIPARMGGFSTYIFSFSRHGFKPEMRYITNMVIIRWV